MKSLRAVLIDLDGTLMDTAPDLAAAANLVRADFGLPALPVERIAAFVGKGADVLVHRALTDRLDGQADATIFVKARAAFNRYYHATNGQETIVFDRVPQALDLLRTSELKLACVTNKPREFTLPLLERLGLTARFDTVVAGDDVQAKKPNPDLLLAACRNLGVPVAAARMIGDSVNDALAAQAAGMRVILVGTGYNEGGSVAELADRPGVDAIVDSLLDAAMLLVEAQHKDATH
ncbi:MAG TPA: phosphoglycolate phosphatase [Burkholderiaceae bacterium]|nr:phosphoglycolate phosphatase [Burkholderiaceae bacterium]